jgi:hypothetical protein
MLVIIAIIVIFADQCAAGAFVCLHRDYYMFLSSSSLLLEHFSFHRSNKNVRVVQKIVHGLLPQMLSLWDATMGPHAIHQLCGFVAVNEVVVQPAHGVRPSCAHSRMLVQVARTTAVKLVVTHMEAFGNVVS